MGRESGATSRPLALWGKPDWMTPRTTSSTGRHGESLVNLHHFERQGRSEKTLLSWDTFLATEWRTTSTMPLWTLHRSRTLEILRDPKQARLYRSEVLRRFTSTIGTIDGVPPPGIRKSSSTIRFSRGQLISIVANNSIANLLYFPTENIRVGGEVQWGRRTNFSDGFRTNDYKLQIFRSHSVSKA